MMALFQSVVRKALRPLILTGMPGRYMLVEWLHPLFVEPGRVRTRTRDDLQWDLDLNDQIQRQIFFGLYDPGEAACLLSLLQPGAVVFDVGANVGYYAILFAHRIGPTGAVHVFEPMPSNIVSLQRNLALNSITDQVTVNQVAVADRAGSIDLFFSAGTQNSGWASVVPSGQRPERITVPTYTLDDYVRERGIAQIDLLKLDIEGSELDALRGMSDLFSQRRVRAVYIEINPFLLQRRGVHPTTIKQYLAGFGYQMYRITAGGIEVVSPHTAEPKLCNVLAMLPDRPLPTRVRNKRQC